MCYYSFNYNTFVLLRLLTKCAAATKIREINTCERTDRHACIPLQKCPGNLVLSILEFYYRMNPVDFSSSFVYHRLILSTLSVGAMLWLMAQLRRGRLRMVVYVVGSY